MIQITFSRVVCTIQFEMKTHVTEIVKELNLIAI